MKQEIACRKAEDGVDCEQVHEQHQCGVVTLLRFATCDELRIRELFEPVGDHEV